MDRRQTVHYCNGESSSIQYRQCDEMLAAEFSAFRSTNLAVSGVMLPWKDRISLVPRARLLSFASLGLCNLVRMIRRTDNSMLVVTADGYGIGPETHAPSSTWHAAAGSPPRLWWSIPLRRARGARGKSAAPNADLGWHANPTVDSPILPQNEVPRLSIRSQGTSGRSRHSCGGGQRGASSPTKSSREWTAQWDRFCQLVGRTPDMVNSNEHVAVLNSPSHALANILSRSGKPPRSFGAFESRSRASCSATAARIQRSVLSMFGARQASRLRRAEYPSCDFLARIANHDAGIDAACLSPPIGDASLWERGTGGAARISRRSG